MFRVAVCISGHGSLVEPLLAAAPTIPVEITCVVADRVDAPGLNSSWADQVETICIDRRQFSAARSLGSAGPTDAADAADAASAEHLPSRSPAEQLSDTVLAAVRERADIVVLAGFLSILKGSIQIGRAHV